MAIDWDVLVQVLANTLDILDCQFDGTSIIVLS